MTWVHNHPTWRQEKKNILTQYYALTTFLRIFRLRDTDLNASGLLAWQTSQGYIFPISEPSFAILLILRC